jgi:hypothetical protein
MLAGSVLTAAPSMATPMTTPTPPIGGFHRRPLFPPAVALSSPRGKQLAKEAMAAGGMEGYWRVAEAFGTQDEPAFCGLGTLVTALNALEVDPGAVWKGSWRWYHEAMLDCCVELEQVKEHGIDFDSWVCAHLSRPTAFLSKSHPTRPGKVYTGAWPPRCPRWLLPLYSCARVSPPVRCMRF